MLMSDENDLWTFLILKPLLSFLSHSDVKTCQTPTVSQVWNLLIKEEDFFYLICNFVQIKDIWIKLNLNIVYTKMGLINKHREL